MTHTLVAFHAHPDDEALLTSGTMARAAAEGHRVVVVVATDGDLGLASDAFAADGGLGARRLEELRRSASALGVARVVYLGYADSGLGPEPDPDPPERVRFVPGARRGGRRAARRRAARGGRRRAAQLRPQRRLRAPRPRARARGRRAGGIPRGDPARARGDGPPRHHRARRRTSPRRSTASRPSSTATAFGRAFSARSEITHRIDVRRYAAAKRASMRAHASQASARGRRRTARWRPSCGSRGRSTTWCSGGSGSSTAPARRAGRCARHLRGVVVSTDRGDRRTRHPTAAVPAADGHPGGVRTGAGGVPARLGRAALREDVVVQDLGGARRTSRSATPCSSWPGSWSGCTATPSPSPGRCAGCGTAGADRQRRRVVGRQPPARRRRGRAGGDLHDLPVVGLLAARHLDLGDRHRGLERAGPHRPAGRSAILGLLAGNDQDVPNKLEDLAVAGALSGSVILGACSSRSSPPSGPPWRSGRARQGPRAAVEAPQHGRALRWSLDLRARINDVVRTGWLSMTLGLVGFFGVYYLLFLLSAHTTGVTCPTASSSRPTRSAGCSPRSGSPPAASASPRPRRRWRSSAGAPDRPRPRPTVVLFSLFTHFMEIPLGALGWAAWSMSPKKAPGRGDDRAGEGAPR